VTQGEVVVQLLPSGNIRDLVGALTTSVKTLCSFDIAEGEDDMVYLGTAAITPNHHIHTTKGWMTALQAVDEGQGYVRQSHLQKVFNLCLEGGGNILINTSSQSGATIFTPAATMGYLLLPGPDSRQYSALSYPADLQTQLGSRQDLSFGNAHFRVGEVRTLPNGTLQFANATGDMSQKQLTTTLIETQISGIPEQIRQGHANSAPSGTTLLQPPPKTLEQCPPKSYTAQGTKDPEPCPATSFCNPPLHLNPFPDTSSLSQSTAESQPDLEVVQEYRLTPHFTSDTHILILKDEVASWTPIWKVKRGCTVMQTLPSGNIGELKGAQWATLEQVLFFKD